MTEAREKAVKAARAAYESAEAENWHEDCLDAALLAYHKALIILAEERCRVKLTDNTALTLDWLRSLLE